MIVRRKSSRMITKRTIVFEYKGITIRRDRNSIEISSMMCWNGELQTEPINEMAFLKLEISLKIER